MVAQAEVNIIMKVNNKYLINFIGAKLTF